MRWLWISPVVLLAAAVLSVPAANIYYQSSWGAGCARCHEIGFNYDEWRHSSHQKINCVECHTSSVKTNLRRVAAHLKGEVPDQVHLGGEDVFAMLPKCQKCHRQEFAQWSSGAHSTTFGRIFNNREYNREHQVVDDCMRCHGMHFDGGIGALVQSVKNPVRASRPAIPCLACHSIHREGAPMMRPSERRGASQEIVRPSVAFFDRRTRVHIATAALPIPAVVQGLRAVRMSPDQRQALCYQCHAPEADRQAGSGDDRTPLGVHEGLSCLACHQKHGEATRQSCAGCHPRLSNCGLDVEKMDTTFRDPKSAHNVHTVQCVDCHLKGVPKTIRRQTPNSVTPHG